MYFGLLFTNKIFNDKYTILCVLLTDTANKQGAEEEAKKAKAAADAAAKAQVQTQPAATVPATATAGTTGGALTGGGAMTTAVCTKSHVYIKCVVTT